MLKIQDGISTRDLSYLLGIRVASLNEMLAKLERSGYVTREPSDVDRRVILIKLTQAGRDASDPQRKPEDVLAVLTAQEQAEMNGYLDRLLEALETHTTDEIAQRDIWAHQARERMGDERFAEWLRAVGEQLGDPRMMRAVAYMHSAPELGRMRKQGRRKRAKYEALMAAFGEFPPGHGCGPEFRPGCPPPDFMEPSDFTQPDFGPVDPGFKPGDDKEE
jgi:DNA-binding MarR family transcriptional regulator